MRWEHEAPVLPLAVPDLRDLPQATVLAGTAAVRLFVLRAQAVKPDFSLTNQNARSVAELCARVDGLPLAIELAAARIKMLTPKAILGRLEYTLDLLTGVVQDAATRHGSLRATLDWSYSLMSTRATPVHPAWAFFRWLDTRGGRGTGLSSRARYPYGARPAQRIGRQVVGGSRTKWRFGRPLQDAGDAPPVLTRAACRKRLAVRGPRQTRAHLPSLCRNDGTPQKWVGPNRQATVDRLEAEHDNLRAALRWVIDSQQSDLAVRFGAVLCWFWFLRSHFTEGRRWLAEILSLQEAMARSSARAWMATAAGYMADYMADHTSAQALHTEGLAIAREVGDHWVEATALRGLGGLALRSDARLARSFQEEGLAAGRAAGDRFLEALALGNLAMVANDQADYAAGRTYASESLTLGRELQDKLVTAQALVHLGIASLGEGDYADAEILLTEGVASNQELGFVHWQAFGLNALAMLSMAHGDFAEAQKRLAASLHLRLNHQGGQVLGIATCIEIVAALAAAQDQHERAVCLAGAAAALRQTIDAAPSPRQLEMLGWLEPLRASIGVDRVAADWARGRAMSLDQVVALALMEPGAPVAGARGATNGAAHAA